MRCVALSRLNLDSDKITLRLSSNEKQFREQDDRTTLHSSNAASIIPVFSDQRNDYKPETLEKNNGKEPSSVD